MRTAFTIVIAVAGCVDPDYSNTEFACRDDQPCPPGFGCAAGLCIAGTGGGDDASLTVVAASCLELQTEQPGATSGVYHFDPGADAASPPFDAYCDMTGDGGGWTLAMKVDGSEQTFAYDAALWETPDTFNPDKPDLDRIEAKLPTFSFVEFTQIRVGMVDADDERWLVVDLADESLLRLFGRRFKATEAGRAAWLALVASGSLQVNCDREGTNNTNRIRLGIVANDGGGCNGPDSFVGLGADPFCDSTITAGNVACKQPVAGDRATAVFGYIMVR